MASRWFTYEDGEPPKARRLELSLEFPGEETMMANPRIGPCGVEPGVAALFGEVACLVS